MSRASRAHRVQSLLPPEAKERYERFRDLGAGGMGEVYRVFDRRLRRDVALKVILLERVAQESYRKRFLREVRAMARLRHMGLVSIYDFHGGEGLWYYTMELVDGTSLRELLDERLPSVDEGLELARHMAAALAVVHEARLLHRDLKPANVMVAADGGIRLMDFGLTKPLEGTSIGGGSLTQTGEVVGTPAYLPPEVVRGRKWNRAADVFQLGLILYELFTGEKALRDLSLPRMLDGTLYTDIRRPREIRPDLPPAVDRLLRSCLHLRPKKRPADGTAVLRVLDRIAAGELDEDEPSPSDEDGGEGGEAERGGRRIHGLGPFLLVFGALVLASVVGTWLGRGGTEALGEARAVLRAGDFPAWTAGDGACIEGLRRLARSPVEGTAFEWALGLSRRFLVRDRELRRRLARVLRRAPSDPAGLEARLHCFIGLVDSVGPGTPLPEDLELAGALFADGKAPELSPIVGGLLLRAGREGGGAGAADAEAVGELLVRGARSPWGRLALEELRLLCHEAWAVDDPAASEVLSWAMSSRDVADQVWLLRTRRLAHRIVRARLRARRDRAWTEGEAGRWVEASRGWADAAADGIWRRRALCDLAAVLGRLGWEVEAEAAFRAARSGTAWSMEGVLTEGEGLVEHVSHRVSVAKEEYPKGLRPATEERIVEALGWLAASERSPEGALRDRLAWQRFVCLLLLRRRTEAFRQVDRILALPGLDEKIADRTRLWKASLSKGVDPLLLEGVDFPFVAIKGVDSLR